MLLPRSHNQNAFEHAPLEKEARLLAFSNGTGGPQPPPPETPSDDDEEEQAPSASQPPSGPESTVNQTRGELGAALEQEERPEGGESGEGGTLSTANVLKAIEDLQQTVVEKHAQIQTILKDGKGMLKRDDWNRLLKVEAFLSLQLTSLQSWKEIVETLKRWEDGNMSPEDLSTWLEKTFNKEASPEDRERWKGTLRTLDSFLQGRTQQNPITRLAIGKMAGGEEWKTQSESKKREISQEVQNLVREIGSLVPTGELLSLMDTNRKALAEGILNAFPEECKRELETLQKTIEEQKSGGEGGDEGFFASIGIRFRSGLEIWEAFKMVGTAYKESFNQYTRLQAAGLAQQIGSVARYLPWGRDIEQILESQLDRANDEVKDSYLNFLKHHRPSFRALFDFGGEMDRNRFDGNRARAVLEYAASRGWLYHIGDQLSRGSNATLFGKYNLGRILASLGWHEKQIVDYISKLSDDNVSGMNNEIKTYEERAVKIDKTEKHIPLFRKELKELNFWGAVGIAYAGTRRGLTGEVSPWFGVTFMRELMANTEMRQYMHYSVLDQLGGQMMYRSAFTLGQVKTNRGDIQNWLRDERLDIGMFGRTIKVVEQNVDRATQELGMTLSPEEKDHTIAKVLAGHNVELKNSRTGQSKILTIFGDTFDNYRLKNTSINLLDPSRVHEEDNDYFNNQSENIFTNDKTYNLILSFGNAKFSQEAKATAFLSHLLKKDIEFDTQIAQGHTELQTAYRNFRREVRNKLDKYLNTTMGDARVVALAQYNTIPSIVNVDTPVISALLKRGLISRTLVERAAEGGTAWHSDGTKLAKQLLAMVGESAVPEPATQVE